MSLWGHYLYVSFLSSLKVKGLVAQLCSTLCSPMDCSLTGSSVHGIFQARILEWVAMSFSRGSSWPRDRIRISNIAGRLFTTWATREMKETKSMGGCKDTTEQLSTHIHNNADPFQLISTYKQYKVWEWKDLFPFLLKKENKICFEQIQVALSLVLSSY